MGRTGHAVNNALRKLQLGRPEFLGSSAGHCPAIKQRTLDSASQFVDQHAILFPEERPIDCSGESTVEDNPVLGEQITRTSHNKT